MSHLSMQEPAASGEPVLDLSKAPLPTTRTLRTRRNVWLQLWRFIAFDLRIMRMVVKGHR